MRPTKMLKFDEVKEDLGVSTSQLNTFIELKMLNPIFLGKGWKFSQEELLEFQRNYRGMDLSNFTKAQTAKEKVDAATPTKRINNKNYSPIF